MRSRERPHIVWPFASGYGLIGPPTRTTMVTADFSPQVSPSPFVRFGHPSLRSGPAFGCPAPFGLVRHEARALQVRTHSLIALPPDLRHLALITKALRLFAHSPCLTAPSIWRLFIGSQFMFHASFPHSVALMQLRFTSLAVISSREDLHLQECAHAGRTKKKDPSRN